MTVLTLPHKRLPIFFAFNIRQDGGETKNSIGVRPDSASESICLLHRHRSANIVHSTRSLRRKRLVDKFRLQTADTYVRFSGFVVDGSFSM